MSPRLLHVKQILIACHTPSHAHYAFRDTSDFLNHLDAIYCCLVKSASPTEFRIKTAIYRVQILQITFSRTTLHW